MRPLFTIHAGEYLVACHIERRLKHVNVWIPSRDTGIDLLVTDHRSRRAVSFQVKFSKDFLITHIDPAFRRQLRACGWWTINPGKLRKSPADFWVFVLLTFEKKPDFVVVPTEVLRRKFRTQARPVIQSYLWVTKDDRCWQTRGLRRDKQLQIVAGEFSEPERDFTKWLNDWSSVGKLNR